MKIKSEKGFTVTDIAIAIVILFIFISLIAILSYNLNSSSQEVELKAQAIEIGVQEIERLKTKTFDEIDTEETELHEIENKDGFYEQILVQDYNEINSERDAGYVKKATVRIEYKFKKKNKSIELSTIISKEI